MKFKKRQINFVKLKPLNDIDRGFISKCNQIISESKDTNKEIMKYTCDICEREESGDIFGIYFLLATVEGWLLPPHNLQPYCNTLCPKCFEVNEEKFRKLVKERDDKIFKVLKENNISDSSSDEYRNLCQQVAEEHYKRFLDEKENIIVN